MANYRKKPVVIEAFKWTGDRNQEEDPGWIIDAIKKENVRIIETPRYIQPSNIYGNRYIRRNSYS